jgi:hypothetical protein
MFARTTHNLKINVVNNEIQEFKKWKQKLPCCGIVPEMYV